MNWTTMRLCAMRLDKTVTVNEFTQAVDDVRREARESAYRDLRSYMESGRSEMRLEDLVERLASGQGWPVPVISPK